MSGSAVLKELNRLSQKNKKIIFQKGLRKAIAPIRKDLRASTPVRYGYLKSGIRSKVKVSDTGGGFGSVGFWGKAGKNKKVSQTFKARFLEHGTKNIEPRYFIRDVMKRHGKNANKILEDTVEILISKL